MAQVKDMLSGKLNAAAQALKEQTLAKDPLNRSVGPLETQEQEKPLALESAEQAEQHRKARGEEEPLSPRKSGLGRHYDIGGVADFGPVDTDRVNQPDTRDIEARVP